MATDKVRRSAPSAQSRLTGRRRLNPRWKPQAYDLLSDLNGGFQIILGSIDRMQALGGFKAGYVHVFRGLGRELQAEFNHYILEVLEEVESADWYRFGKIRAARDKHLQGPLPKLPASVTERRPTKSRR